MPTTPSFFAGTQSWTSWPLSYAFMPQNRAPDAGDCVKTVPFAPPSAMMATVPPRSVVFARAVPPPLVVSAPPV